MIVFTLLVSRLNFHRFNFFKRFGMEMNGSFFGEIYQVLVLGMSFSR